MTASAAPINRQLKEPRIMTDTAPNPTTATATPASDAAPPPASLEDKIDIYKTFIDTAERTIERRMRANQFYFYVVAALVIAYAWLAESQWRNAAPSISARITSDVSNAASTPAATAAIEASNYAPPLWALPLFLLVVSLSWLMLLRGFRALSAAKYATINEIEKDLPLQPFLREREHYKKLGRSRATTWEMAVPVLCAAIAILGLTAPFL
jgi:hypothetical protein